MPAAGQGHIPPLHLSILNYSSCCLHMPPCTPTTPFPAKFLATPVHISTPNLGHQSLARWQVESSAWRRLWRPCTAYLHLVFIQFSFRRKSSQPSSPYLISLPLQTRYLLCTHSQAAECWQDGLGLQRFCSLPTCVALLSPAQARVSGEEVCAAAGVLTSGLLGGQSSFCIMGRLKATLQTTPVLSR